MNKQSKIYIAGHLGMVGSAIHRNLLARGYQHFVLRSMEELDLCRQEQVEAFFQAEKPEYVFVAAAKVGGIIANNSYRAQFIYENLMIQNNVIHAAWRNGVKKLLFLGSSCIYPKHAPQPLQEDYLLTGLLEPTNEPYAIAKIAGIKMCESYYRQYGCDFISVMPTNLYGPNDNYDLEKSHVLPALIRKMHLAKCLDRHDWPALRADLNRRPIDGIDGSHDEETILKTISGHGVCIGDEPGREVSVSLWGSGEVYREFLHVDDMADASIFVMQDVNCKKLYGQLGKTHINIGTGRDMTIKELALLVKEITGFGGQFAWDKTKPDGVPKKQLDVGLLTSLGWQPSIALEEGIRQVYGHYLAPGLQ